MPPRKELCRNFQRGSCSYGARCKFIHATSQNAQQPSNNPFGFGAQSSSPFQQSNQQQTQNPFGFGVANNNQQRGPQNFGSNSAQTKPFQNTWSRSSNVPAARQSGSQSQPPPSHKCINPEDCKRVMMEDFQNEKPMWKLTCYGHNKDGPCDIVGDISPEELRALAYDEAKQGKNLQLIVERERNLLNSKLAEFQNLLQNPSMVSSAALNTQSPFGGTAALNTQSPFGGTAALNTQSPFGGTASSFNTNSGVTPQVSSFSQLGPLVNTGSAAASSYAFGQPSAMQNNANPSSMVQNNPNPSNFFQSNNGSGAFGNQPSSNSVTNSFSFAPGNSNNSVTNPFSLGPGNSSNSVTNPFSFGTGSSSNSVASPIKNPFSTFGNPTQFGNAAANQSQFASNVSHTAPDAVDMSSIISVDNLPNGNNVEDKLWTKSEWSWNKGEIPEQAPPDVHVR